MSLIDTHCHIYLEEFDPEQDMLIREAQESGIGGMLLPNVDETTIERMLSICDHYPGYAHPMMGLHPTSVDGHYASRLHTIESRLHERPYCAIGEIGIDLYWDKTYLKEQKIVFEEQLRWSLELNLPVAIHTRDAFPEVFDSIHKVDPERLTGVFHSFGGSVADLEEIKKLQGFKLGINGVVTFKNAQLTSVLAQTTMQHIVFETDAPYLAPVPYRGKRNNPIYIWQTVQKVAELYEITREEALLTAEKNTAKVFKNIENIRF